MNDSTAEFLRKFYERGLAEFAFKNGISLQGHVRFRSTGVSATTPIKVDLPRRTCVPVGGGKDSIVTMECLKQSGEPLVLFSLGDAEPITACIEAAKLPFIRVYRRLDPGIFRLNQAGALNGHVPITGILSAVALASAVMFGCDTVAMSNEHSASAANLSFDGLEINHQYSKSFEFEQDFAQYIKESISPSINYFSLLRPLSEIEIARRFSKYQEYFGVFRSCNTAFRQAQQARGRHWCCDCPKCRFIFLALAPFVAKPDLIEIFGRNLLDDDAQSEGFAELCGLRANKPFECVGEISESTGVMSQLVNDPDWRDDRVVRRLNEQLASLPQPNSSQYRALFETKHPHRVPQRYLAMLDACG
ncbi:MAG: endonuclease domain-containing protein [Alphaproteobacteria bacterium]|nr:endonuclease domain-containing protein [Alphaproteobacteria bacterium]